MSILIKGMGMPKDCPFCPMAHFNKLDALTGCDAVPGKRYVKNDEAKYWLSDKRPDWCPLVEVPKPQNRPATWGDVYDSLKVLEALLETIEAEEGEAHDA